MKNPEGFKHTSLPMSDRTNYVFWVARVSGELNSMKSGMRGVGHTRTLIIRITRSLTAPYSSSLIELE